MPLTIKSVKNKERTTVIVFEDDMHQSVQDESRKDVACLSLLFGLYNPLRAVSKDANGPIDLDKLQDYQTRLKELMREMKWEMNLDSDLFHHWDFSEGRHNRTTR